MTSPAKTLSALRASKLSAVFQRNRAIEKYMLEPNHCLQCKNIILVLENQKVHEVRLKKFCNRSCAATYNNAIVGNRHGTRTHPCASCGTAIPVSSTVRCPKCIAVCPSYHQSLFLKNVTLWLENKYIATTRFARAALIHFLGPKCQKCGWCEVNTTTKKVPVQIHHIDGDDSNNARSNVELLCPNCHSLTPNYMALNK